MNQNIKEIEESGYCILRNHLSNERVKRTLDLVEYWNAKSSGDITDDKPSLARDDPFLWNPQNKDHYFLDTMFCSPDVEKILMHFLNDRWFKPIPPDKPNYILRNLLARKGEKTLPMHIDSLVPYQGEHVFVMQVSMVLEDQDAANGCTLVVPGSHLSGKYVDQSAFDYATPVETKAGDVVVWDSRIWHGAQANESGRSRWSLIATYTRWWLKQMFDIPRNLPQEIYDQLTDSQKAVLGFCSIPFGTETDGIDMKRDYDSLLKDVAGYRA